MSNKIKAFLDKKKAIRDWEKMLNMAKEVATKVVEVPAKDDETYSFSFKLDVRKSIPSHLIESSIQDLSRQFTQLTELALSDEAAVEIDPSIRLHVEDNKWILYSIMEEVMLDEKISRLKVAVRYAPDNGLYTENLKYDRMRKGRVRNTNIQCTNLIVKQFGNAALDTIFLVMAAMARIVSKTGSLESARFILEKVAGDMPDEPDLDLGSLQELKNVLKNGGDRMSGGTFFDEYTMQWMIKLINRGTADDGTVEVESIYHMISGYWKNDKTKFKDYVVTSLDHPIKGIDDDLIFYYAIGESMLQSSMTGRAPDLEFVVTKYEPCSFKDGAFKTSY